MSFEHCLKAAVNERKSRLKAELKTSGIQNIKEV
jgi:hypothetical protein